jgi:hypothetical protein
MRRLIAIPLLLVVLVWPAENAIAATAMGASHACCQRKAASSCNEHGEHMINASQAVELAARHAHEQCPMDCCSKRQASGNAYVDSPATIRSTFTHFQNVILRSREAHDRLRADVHGERAPPTLV